MTKRNFLHAALFALILAWIPVNFVAAQAPTPSDDQVNAIARKLYCPVCENISLDVCGTQACAQWRDLIRQKLVQGWSEQQIEDYFAKQYGERVLAVPPQRGINWLIYVLPPVFLLAGAVILWRVLFHKRKIVSASAGQLEQAQEKDAYLKRMEEDIRRREEKY